MNATNWRLLVTATAATTVLCGSDHKHRVLCVSRHVKLAATAKPMQSMTAARDLADAKHQEQRWLAVDAAAWEQPAELLNVLLDDMNFELYIEELSRAFSL